MRQLYVLTEEESARPVIEALFATISEGLTVSCRVITHQGKDDLLKAITKTVPSLSRIPNTSILVLHDQDQNDCRILKAKIVHLMEQHCQCHYKIRIVCQELEAWYFGDIEAIKLCYEVINQQQLTSRTKRKNVDEIVNPSHELLKYIREYHKLKTLPKVQMAKRVAVHLNVDRNTSTSFKMTTNAILELLQ